MTKKKGKLKTNPRLMKKKRKLT